jgi:beta-N-acetylhexosaminidase
MKAKITIATFILLLISFGLASSNTFAQVSLEEKIGQMIMTGFSNEGASRDTLNRDLTSGVQGNVLTFRSNLQSPSQIKELTTQLQQTAKRYPLLIGVDQEGGRVARLTSSNGYRTTSSAAFIGRFRNSEFAAKNEAYQMAVWLKDAGLNFNLAPVADVNVNPASPAIGGLDRSYSSNEEVVYNHVKWATDSYHEEGIATALKHYPGHGSAMSDSHLGFTDISTTWEERELSPYKNLIEAGYVDAIMTGHLFKEDWDAKWPASLSKYMITDILRDSLGFKGLVISDELFMRAIKDNFGFDEAVIQAIKAGTDILLFSTNLFKPNEGDENTSLPRYIVELVKTKIANNELDESLIDDAYNRVMALKELRLGVPTSTPEEEIISTLPTEFNLGAYPNPFNPTTTVDISLGQTEQIKVDVFNAMGQKMLSIAERRLSAGTHQLQIAANNWPSGLYLIRASTPTRSRVIKVTLMK